MQFDFLILRIPFLIVENEFFLLENEFVAKYALNSTFAPHKRETRVYRFHFNITIQF